MGALNPETSPSLGITIRLNIVGSPGWTWPVVPHLAIEHNPAILLDAVSLMCLYLVKWCHPNETAISNRTETEFFSIFQYRGWYERDWKSRGNMTIVHITVLIDGFLQEPLVWPPNRIGLKSYLKSFGKIKKDGKIS